MPENPLIARLLDPQQVIVFDGAMGTMLYNKGVFINQCYDELNIRAPDLVRDVHKAYRKAGAEVLETNTFGANRIKLAQYGLEAQVAEINRAAAKLARDVAEDDILVAGAVGPLGIRLEPFGPTSLDEARAAFREQLQALKDGGCDVFILETFADVHEIEQAIRAAHEVDSTIPVIAQMTIGALPSANGDPALLRQVWINLLSNALKYSARQPSPRIEVAGERSGADLVYRVSDNGAGFDMRYYDKLFRVFQRLHRADEFPGTGVGLAIVQRIITRHGGRVWAEAEVGKGAKFFFTLPVPSPL